jgi:hypothetical protein
VQLADALLECRVSIVHFCIRDQLPTLEDAATAVSRALTAR